MAWFVPTVIAFIATVLFMIVLRPVARAIQLVDKPGGRKAHQGAVPVIGGIAMYVGFLLGFLLSSDVPDAYRFLPIAISILVVVGVLDDRFSLTTGSRFLAQILAVLIMVYGGGLIMRDIGNPLGIGMIGLGPLALFLTVVITLSVINAFNLIDGVDGLAGGMVLAGLIGIAVVSMPHVAAKLAIVIGGCVAGYLLFNLPMPFNKRLRSFMGDAGSTMLGFIIVWLTISICQGNDRVISPVVGLWFAALPLFDLFTCFVRRALKGKSPLRGGRDHIHHTLRRGGLSSTEILVVLTSLNSLYVMIGVLGHFSSLHETLLWVIWAIVGLSQYTIIRKVCVFRRAMLRKRSIAY